MKKSIILFLILNFTAIIAQENTLNSIKISTEPIDSGFYIGSDTFGYYYTIENNVLFKHNSTKNLTYKNIQLGKITTVDIISPLRIILFYEDFNTVVILDDQFSETAVINFSQNNNPIVATAVGLAAQNQLWIYNSLNQQIGLYDYLNNEYKTISIPLKNDAIVYQTNFNLFFWVDINNNWFSCDLFGKITLIAKINSFDAIQFLNNRQFIYKKDNQLYFYEIDKNKSNSQIPIEISEKSFTNFHYKEQILSIFTTSEKTNYKIILP